MENGGINKKDKTKAENNAESDVETAVLEKIKEYTVDDGGLPSEAESTYLQLMAKLRAAYGHQVDMPVSLDKYFHESIGENELNVRNGDQVISRFIARQRAETDRITTELRSATGATEQGPQHDKSPGELEAGFGDQPQTRAVTDQFCQRILTVPRFWIWKLDSEYIDPTEHHPNTSHWIRKANGAVFFRVHSRDLFSPALGRDWPSGMSSA